MENKLVSIGVPTYNRPEGLRKTLECIIKQSYKNIEVIISDNCSTDPNVSLLINEFMEKDSRIKYFRHSENLGGDYNFKFLFDRASSDYFMWACDDDYFVSENLIEELMEHAAENILCFSDFVRSNDVNTPIFLNSYGNCQSKMDYIVAWLSNRSGQPIYGLYNLKLMAECSIKFLLDQDLDYYNEGTMLHKLFLSGKVKFVPNVLIYCDVNSTKPSAFQMTSSFIEYYDRTVTLFKASTLNESEKDLALKMIRAHNSNYLYAFYSSLGPEEKQVAFFKILEKGF